MTNDWQITGAGLEEVANPDAPGRGDTQASAAEREANERIDDALRMTFPASDPPAWAGGGPRPAPTAVAPEE